MHLMCVNGGDCQRNGMKVATEKLLEQKPKEENEEKQQ